MKEAMSRELQYPFRHSLKHSMTQKATFATGLVVLVAIFHMAGYELTEFNIGSGFVISFSNICIYIYLYLIH